MYKILIKGEKEERAVDDREGLRIMELWKNESNNRVRIKIGGAFVLCGDIKRIERFGFQENAWEKKRQDGLQENLQYINKCNKKLRAMPPKDRATAEIKDRILNGLNEEQKNSFTPFYEPLHKKLAEYFERNPKMPRCPMNNWIKVIKEMKIISTSFFALVARNDGAVERWANFTGEWENFVEDPNFIYEGK
jgi:hypothetical protein